MNHVIIYAATCMLFASSYSQAQNLVDPELELTPEQLSRLLPNMAGDLDTCSAFYDIVSECLNNTQPGSGDEFYTLSLQTLQQSAIMTALSSRITLEKAGQTVDEDKLANTALKSSHLRYESDKKEMLQEMVTCENISILTSQHLESCNGYFQDPESLMAKWILKLRD